MPEAVAFAYGRRLCIGKIVDVSSDSSKGISEMDGDDDAVEEGVAEMVGWKIGADDLI